jgi:hypothetical protein
VGTGGTPHKNVTPKMTSEASKLIKIHFCNNFKTGMYLYVLEIPEEKYKD